MAGLSHTEFDQIPSQHVNAIARELSTRSWEWVLVLTVANFPGSSAPRLPTYESLAGAYSTFRKKLASELQVPLQDFWIIERGTLNGRLHMNALLQIGKHFSPNLFVQIWKDVAASTVYPIPYDAAKGVSYWIKDIALDGEVVHYGGSALGADRPIQTKPRRKRKSFYNRTRRRIRYRPQPGALLKQP